jgi:hypothetical protein
MQWIGRNTVLTRFGVNSLSDAQREFDPERSTERRPCTSTKNIAGSSWKTASTTDEQTIGTIQRTPEGI